MAARCGWRPGATSAALWSEVARAPSGPPRGVLLTGMMGALSQQIVDAMAGNPALSTAMGIAGGRPRDGFVSAAKSTWP